MQQARPAHFPLFDSLRAIAALLVFTIHSTYQIAVGPAELDAWWFRFGVHLDVAVPIFFAVSGFLLYRPFVAATLDGQGLDVRAYAWRRVLRIVPAYWVALAAITVWFDLDEVQSVAGALQFGLFAQIYDADTALRGLGQAWTLNVEVAFYAFLPLFALLLVRARTVRQALIGVLALVLGSLAWKVGVLLAATDAASREQGPWLYPLPAQLDHLGMGMLLAVLSVAAARRGDRLPGLAGRGLGLVERRPWVAWTAAVALWVLCALATESGSRYGAPITDPQYLVKHGLYLPVLFFLLLPAVFGDHSGVGWPRRVLAWRPLAWVGTVSYSFYLWHYAVIAQLLEWWGRAPAGAAEWAAWYAAALAGGLAFGALGFYAVERPFMSLKRLVPVRSRAPQVEAAQARAAP